MKEVFSVADPVKEVNIPITVPRNPTNGAVAATVATLSMRRFISP